MNEGRRDRSSFFERKREEGRVEGRNGLRWLRARILRATSSRWCPATCRRSQGVRRRAQLSIDHLSFPPILSPPFLPHRSSTDSSLLSLSSLRLLCPLKLLWKESPPLLEPSTRPRRTSFDPTRRRGSWTPSLQSEFALPFWSFIFQQSVDSDCFLSSN